MKISSVIVLSITALLAVKLDGVEASGGGYKLIKSKDDDDLCWGVSNVKDGARVKLVKCDDDDDEQLWDLDNGKIKNKDDDDFCIQVKAKENKGLRLRKCKNTSRQKWNYDKNNDNEWTPKKDDDLCVQHKGGGSPEKGDKLILKDCDGDDEQEWEWD